MAASANHIALFVHKLGGGGAERRMATLANRFAELGRRVDVLTLDAGGVAGEILSPAVRLLRIARGRGGMLTVFRAPALAAYLRENHPDVLMSGITNSHALAVAAQRLAGETMPVVLRASRHPLRTIPRSRPMKRLIEVSRQKAAAAVYRRADAIVAVSAGVAEGLEQLLGTPRPPIVTILNPVVVLAAHVEERPTAAEPLVLGIGRFVLQKDFETLIAAMALLRQRVPARLMLLGEGKLRDRYAALANRSGVPLDMPGEVNDVPDRLTRADLLTSSSLWEGLQATLIEALASGCPVVATDCPGGAREVLEDGRLGPLVPVGDPAALAAAMERRLAAPRDAAMLVRGAARFTFDGKAEAYLDLFDACVSRDSGR